MWEFSGSNIFPNSKDLLCNSLSVEFLRGAALASCWKLRQCNPLTYLPWDSFIILLAGTYRFLLVFSSVSSLSLLLFFFFFLFNSMVLVFPLQGLSSVILVYRWISVYQSRDSDTYGPWSWVIFPAMAPSGTLLTSFLQRETPQLQAPWWLRVVRKEAFLKQEICVAYFMLPKNITLIQLAIEND